MFRSFFQVVVPMLFAVGLVYGQQATVSGFVKDGTGAYVPAALVTIRNEATNLASTTQTNESGVYSLPSLQPGSYQLTVTAPGFETNVTEKLRLETAGRITKNVVLQVGKASQAVTVDGSGLAINTADASVSTVINRQFVENIPLNGRSFQSLLTLVPGVSLVPAVGGAFNTSGSSVGYGGEVSVNGQRSEANYFTVDGVSVNTGASPAYNLGNGAGVSGSTPGETVLGTTQSMVSIDALEEFRATTSTYSSEYGRSPGGQFSFSTRSGTNQWHGSAYDYLRNDVLDANNWFGNQAGLTKAKERQNDFGGTLGGPVRIPGLYNGTDRTFFFASYEGLRLSAPQSALTTNVPSDALRAGAPAVLQPFLNAFPKANGRDLGDGLAEFVSGYSNPSTLDTGSIRLDHALNDRFKFFARYGRSPSSASIRYTSNLAVNTQEEQQYDTATAGFSSVLSPRLNNELRFNFTRNNVSLLPHMDNFGGATPLSVTTVPGLVDTSQLWLFLSWDLMPELQLAPESNTQHQLNVTDQFSAVLGRHTWKWGVDWRRLANSQSIPVAQESGEFISQDLIYQNRPDFVGLWTFGMPVHPVYTNFSAFGQDEWRVNSRLTLSLGLRWDINPAPHDAFGNNPYTVTSTDLATMQVAARDTPLWQTRYANFAPRVGVAYQAHSAPGFSTVLRAGGGLFYDTGNQQGSIGYNGLGQGGITYLYDSSFPVDVQQIAAVPAASAAAPYNNFVLGFDPHLKSPYSLQWNAAVEQGLGEKQTLTLNYVGAANRQLLQQKAYDPSLVGNDAFSQGFGVQLTTNGVNASYQALQARFQRTLSHGLQALASYAWAHNIDDATSNFEIYQLLRANSDNDIRHTFQAALTYDIPGRYRNSILSGILRNWSTDLRLFARSALPVDINSAPELSPITGQQISFHPNLVGGQPLYLNDAQAPGGRVINFNAFSPALDADGNGTEGNLGRNALRGFGATQTDLAVRRQFQFGETLNLQVRAEAFNLFNHPIWGSIYNQLSNGETYFGRVSNTLNTQLGGLNALYQSGGPRSFQLELRLQF